MTRKLKRLAMKRNGAFKRKAQAKKHQAIWNPKPIDAHFGTDGKLKAGK